MNRRTRTIVHLTLGLAMLAVVVAAGLTPNTGVVQASSNCTYGQCPSSQPFPLWAVSASVAAVVIALLLAFLLLRRRRRPGQPPSEWEGPQGPGGAPPGASGPEGPAEAVAAGAAPAVVPEATPEPLWHEGTPAPPTEEAPPKASSEYVETPSEPAAGVAPPPPPPPAPAVSPPPTAAPAAAGPPAPAEEAEPDIDSLMAELEKISGEILKQKPKKKTGSPPPGPSADESP